MPDGTIMKDTDMKDYIKTTNVLTKPKSVKEKVKAIEKKTTPKPKTKSPPTESPKLNPIPVDDDKNRAFLIKVTKDVEAFNKKYTAASFKKVSGEARKKLLDQYNKDAESIQKDNLILKDKIKPVNGEPPKFYNDYLSLIRKLAEQFGKFSRVRKNIKKLF